MRLKVRSVASVLALVLVAAACGGSSAKPTPTVSATMTPSTVAAIATVAVSPTPPPPSPSPTSRVEVSSTVQLAEAATGTVKTIYESGTTMAFMARFAGSRVLVWAGPDLLQFELDGTRSTAPLPPTCVDHGASVTVAGQSLDGARCGSLSPDNRLMLYGVDQGETILPSGSKVPVSDEWLVDMTTGEKRMVQPGLVACGGCDGRYGPRWSPDSRYVAFAETGGDQRRFLTDAQSWATIRLADGNDLTDAPQWSVSGDLLLYDSRASGRTFIQNVASGSVRELPLAWPAAFDASGTLVYSPAAGDPKAQGPQTTVLDAATGAVVETLNGAPAGSSAYLLLDGTRALARTTNGIVAALQGAPGCAGTAIYVDARVSPCIAGGVHGEVSPSGVVAVARSTGSVGPVYGPGFSMLSMDRFDIDIVPVADQLRTVIHDALSPIGLTLTWSADGSHLLVLWPSGGGFK